MRIVRAVAPVVLGVLLLLAPTAPRAAAQCSAPGNVSASDGLCLGVMLSWNSAGSVLGYRIWRNTTPDPGTASVLANLPSVTSFIDSAAAPGSTYHYWVQSLCLPTGTSPLSAMATGSRPPLPVVPTGLQASQGTRCDGVLLSWNLPPAGIGYRIHRATNDIFDNAELLAVVEGADSFLDTTAPASTFFNALWYFIEPVTVCGTGEPTSVKGWRCVPAPQGIGVPDLAVSNWRSRAIATLVNACRVGPQQYRDFFFADVSGINLVLQPANHAPLPPLTWSHEIAAATNYHAIDVSTTPGCVPGFPAFASCNGLHWFDRLNLFLTLPLSAAAHHQLSVNLGSDPPEWFVEAMENPAYHIGFHILGGFSPLPDGPNAFLRNFIFDVGGSSASTHFGVGLSVARALYGSAFGAIEKITSPAETSTGIVIAAHTPNTDDDEILYIAVYHDPTGSAPQSAEIEVDGQWQALELMTGVPAQGAFLFREPMCGAEEECRRYRFRFVTAGGDVLHYPELGLLTTAGLPCDCDDEWEEIERFPCVGDLDGSGAVDGADLGVLLSRWGTPDPAADLNGDGVVDGADLGMLLSAWGACG